MNACLLNHADHQPCVTQPWKIKKVISYGVSHQGYWWEELFTCLFDFITRWRHGFSKLSSCNMCSLVGLMAIVNAGQLYMQSARTDGNCLCRPAIYAVCSDWWQLSMQIIHLLISKLRRILTCSTDSIVQVKCSHYYCECWWFEW